MTPELHSGDCLDILPRLPRECARLVYLDPPFNTQRTHRAAAGSYADSYGSPQQYVAWMRPRIEALCGVLDPHGAMFFHCDARTAHYVKVMLDDVFCAGGGVFVNEIVWRYGLGASRPGRRLLTKHDVIFWYAKGPSYVFNLLRGEPTPAMLNKYRHVDEEGRRYMISYGKRYYLKGGKPLDDVWDIPAIAATSGERVGYPTQKPLALLNRIVRLASNPGDLILDPFCGSGTTLVAAHRLLRRTVGIDLNPQAVQAARSRIEGLEAAPETHSTQS
jgi:site-specific DNA-methyltransferase (adenine-specific)